MPKLRTAIQKLFHSVSSGSSSSKRDLPSSNTSNSTMATSSSFKVVSARDTSASSPIVPIPTGGPFYFSPSSSCWVPYTETSKHGLAQEATNNASPQPRPLSPSDTINLITWNIDFVAPHKQVRTSGLLAYLRHQIASNPIYSSSTGTVILLQEIRNPVEGGRTGILEGGMMDTILEDEWVREQFFLSNLTIKGRYGTASLVSRGIDMVPATMDSIPRQTQLGIDSIKGCFRAPEPHTIFGRDILCTDLLLSNGTVLRIGNTHLESPFAPEETHSAPTRQLQIILAASLFRKEGVSVGIIGGDMNACKESDFVLTKREDVRLRDVWEEIVGEERATELDFNAADGRFGEGPAAERGRRTNCGEEGGHTWGYQCVGEPDNAPRRLDKFFFCDNEGAKIGLESVKRLERLGVGVRVGDVVGESEVPGESEAWLSDHFGLLTKFVLTAR